MTGNSEAQLMDTIPLRVNDLERARAVDEHRLKALEDERLGHRMALTERSAEEAKEGVAKLQDDVATLRHDQAEGFAALGKSVGRISSLFRGAVWAFGVVGTLLVILNITVDLIPKLDAIIIDKNPPVAAQGVERG
ncbi:hypothetical protein [Alcanivorax sp.]|uniref:hypothetical protein n=1 Tax=Alcanivorax sp. TaxID=1872427 RepID=UPI0032D9A194